MLECSLGKINEVIVRRALSGYQFVEFSVPLDVYVDSPKFTLTIDGVASEYTVIGNEVYMHPGDKTVMKVSAIKSDMSQWLDVEPASFDSADISKVLKGYGLEDGPKISVSFLNLFLSKGQLSVVLSNMAARVAFVDFLSNKVVYYNELYKQKPVQLQVPFRKLYGRAPIAGYIGWDTEVNGSFPYDAQSVMSFGNFTGIGRNMMENLVNNCNDIARLFTDMQVFTWPEELSLGTTVLSQLTMDKRVVVAAEEHWDASDNVAATYYCI